MTHAVTIEPQPPIDASVDPPDVVDVVAVDAEDTTATVIPPDHDAVEVTTSEAPIDATVEVAPVLEAQVTVEDGVDAQVLTSGFITIIRDGGDLGFVEWVEYSYLDVGANLVKVLSAGQIVEAIRVTVLEVFDGSPTVDVGSAADPDQWLSLGALELGIACEYHNESLTKFATAEQILLTLSAAGSTQGRVGLLYRVVG
jgi:hypothetical protein